MVKTVTLSKSGNYAYRLEKSGEELEVVGRFWVKNQEKLEIKVEVVHVAEDTKARVSIKVGVDDGGWARVRGNVVVEEKAKNTESFLEERILLLSDKAKAEAIPDLEIKNNQVKCSHAATVGRIDEEQVFYLNSRGVGETEAKKMIAEGFLK